MTYQEILTFWFEECTPADWFGGGVDFDAQIKLRFEATYHAVVAGETASWRETAEGALAEIIVLDQLSRNMFRGTAAVFAADGQALALAQVAVARGFDQALSKEQRHFMYMPYMHSESVVVHEAAVPLFEALGDPDALEYEMKHKKIIEAFERYPHRNAQLGRDTTEEEKAYLESTNEGFFNS